MSHQVCGFAEITAYTPNRYPRVTRAGGGFGHTFGDDKDKQFILGAWRNDWDLCDTEIIPDVGLLTLKGRFAHRNHWPLLCENETYYKAALGWDDVVVSGVIVHGRNRTSEDWEQVAGSWLPGVDTTRDATGLYMSDFDVQQEFTNLETERIDETVEGSPVWTGYSIVTSDHADQKFTEDMIGRTLHIDTDDDDVDNGPGGDPANPDGKYTPSDGDVIGHHWTGGAFTILAITDAVGGEGYSVLVKGDPSDIEIHGGNDFGATPTWPGTGRVHGYTASVKTALPWHPYPSLLWRLWYWEPVQEDYVRGTTPSITLTIGDIAASGEGPPSTSGYRYYVPIDVGRTDEDEELQTEDPDPYDFAVPCLIDHATNEVLCEPEKRGLRKKAHSTVATGELCISMRWITRDLMLLSNLGDGTSALVDMSNVTLPASPMLWIETYGVRIATSVSPIVFPSSGTAVRTTQTPWCSWQSDDSTEVFSWAGFSWASSAGPVLSGSSCVDTDSTEDAEPLPDGRTWPEGYPMVTLSPGTPRVLHRFGPNLWSPAVLIVSESRWPTLEMAGTPSTVSIEQYAERVSVLTGMDGRGSKAEADLVNYGSGLDGVVNGAWCDVALGMVISSGYGDDEILTTQSRQMLGGFLKFTQPKRSGDDDTRSPRIGVEVVTWTRVLTEATMHLFDGFSFGGWRLDAALALILSEVGYPCEPDGTGIGWAMSNVTKEHLVVPACLVAYDGIHVLHAYDANTSMMDAIDDLCVACGARVRLDKFGNVEVFIPERWDGEPDFIIESSPDDPFDGVHEISHIPPDGDAAVSAILHKGIDVNGYARSFAVFDDEAAWDTESPFYQGGPWKWSVNSDDGNVDPVATAWQEWERIRRHRLKLGWSRLAHLEVEPGDVCQIKTEGMRLSRGTRAADVPSECYAEVLESLVVWESSTSQTMESVTVGVVRA